MAYMNAEHAKTIRTNLKTKFPNFKFSVTIRHHSAIVVSLLSSPLNFDKDITASGYNYVQLNHYYLENYEHTDTLKQIYNVINEGNNDNSEPQSDYTDVGWYINFHIGNYEKPYKQITSN